MSHQRLSGKKSWVQDYFDIRAAVVQVRQGETEEEAWQRHLQTHPEDSHANIKIFNRRPLTLLATR